nr:hypothetical protein Iba_chr08dCG3630 [Ipomoea batatas]
MELKWRNSSIYVMVFSTHKSMPYFEVYKFAYSGNGRNKYSWQRKRRLGTGKGELRVEPARNAITRKKSREDARNKKRVESTPEGESFKHGNSKKYLDLILTIIFLIVAKFDNPKMPHISVLTFSRGSSLKWPSISANILQRRQTMRKPSASSAWSKLSSMERLLKAIGNLSSDRLHFARLKCTKERGKSM